VVTSTANLSSIASLLSAVAWPIVAIVLAIIFRSELQKLLRRLKTGPAGTEFYEPEPEDSKLETVSASAEVDREPEEALAAESEPTPLETAIVLGADRAVLDQLKQSEVFALGQPAGTITTAKEGTGSESTESDLLHYTADDEKGNELVFLPLFTRPEFMDRPLRRNSEWQSLSTLRVDGGDVLENIDGDVTLVINPWSRLEFRVPSRDEVRRSRGLFDRPLPRSPAGESPADEPPAGSPAGESPADEPPAGSPAGEPPAGSPTGESPADEPPAGQA
jgi:hypothetical protein